MIRVYFVGTPYTGPYDNNIARNFPWREQIAQFNLVQYFGRFAPSPSSPYSEHALLPDKFITFAHLLGRCPLVSYERRDVTQKLCSFKIDFYFSYGKVTYEQWICGARIFSFVINLNYVSRRNLYFKNKYMKYSLKHIKLTT